MKIKHLTLNFLFFLNYILVILYISRLSCNAPLTAQDTIPLLLASFMMVDMTYISACNIRENKVITLFCALLVLDCWYLLLLPDTSAIAKFAFIALSPIIWYASAKFLLLFLFQGSGYKFRTSTNIILLITCAAAIIGIGISSQVYALLYGMQLLASCLCLAFVLLYHRKRTVFVLKSERKSILFSVVITVAAFLVYYFATTQIPNHISNFGIYLPVLLFCISIHGIVHKEHQRYPLSVLFSPRQTMFILTMSVLIIVLTNLCKRNPLCELCIAVNMLFALINLCNIILGYNLKNDKNSLIRQSKYSAVLQQLQKEEQLKTDFANFLHDDILQDILSVKNLLPKAHRSEVQDILVETLDHLNTTIRKQMQDYHPVILKNLTIRENYQNLLDAVSQSFPQRNIAVSFDCSDTLFLVEPYNLLVYRLLKELLTNVYKHSDGNHAWIMLSLENHIIESEVVQNTVNKNNILQSDIIKNNASQNVFSKSNTLKNSFTRNSDWHNIDTDSNVLQNSFTRNNDWYNIDTDNNVPHKTTTENNVIILCIADDGTASAACLTSTDKTKHKGICSIIEQVHSLSGTIFLCDNTPHGICIQIQIPMKGELSYEYFVSR